ncbi:hypothetical protein ABVT39_009848 [Epinephelus coioides]
MSWKPKCQAEPLLDQTLQDLANFQTSVSDRSRQSVALIERSHRSNLKPWKPKHVNRDDPAAEERGGRSAWLDSKRSRVQPRLLSTAEEAELAALSPAGAAACSSFNPHFNYSGSVCSHVPEEIPDFLRLKISSEKLVQPPGNQTV